MTQHTLIKNIILLGDSSVGKTSLIRRFVVDKYSDKYISTIGTKVTKKEITLRKNKDITNMTLMIWDIIGQKGYRYTQSMTFQRMDGAFLVADLTRKDTLESLKSYWIPLILRTRGPIPMIYLGNKSDLAGEHQFELADMQKTAESCLSFGSGRACFLTSAKTGVHVEEAFTNIAKLVQTTKASQKLGIPYGLMGETEIRTIHDVLDHIIADFADQYGGLEHATPVIKHQLELSGLNLAAPSEVAIIQFIDRLAKMESSFKDKSEVEKNRMNRLKLFSYKKK